jgi:hypothetical protein
MAAISCLIKNGLSTLWFHSSRCHHGVVVDDSNRDPRGTNRREPMLGARWTMPVFLRHNPQLWLFI